MRPYYSHAGIRSRTPELVEGGEAVGSDLQFRGLRSGDRYLTVAEAALMLEVSMATAYRAMELLVRKELLVRQHGRGTFVGAGIGKGMPAQVQTVFVLMPEENCDLTSAHVADMVGALRTTLNGIGVQLGFVPTRGSLEYVRQLIGTADCDGKFVGAVPVGCPRAVYAYLEALGRATVLLGSPCGNHVRFSSVDVDHHQIGYLLARHLVGKGHRRLALLLTGEDGPGNSAFFDGISDALTEATLPHNALTFRIYPQDFQACRAQVRDLFERSDRPTGIICSTDPLVGIVELVATHLGLGIPRHIEIVFQGESTRAVERLPYVHTKPQLTFKQVAALVANMLRRLSNGEQLEQDHVVVLVELREPQSGRRCRG